MATTFLSPAVQTKKGCRNRFCVCFWLNVCVIPPPLPPRPICFPFASPRCVYCPHNPHSAWLQLCCCLCGMQTMRKARAFFWRMWREVGGKKTRAAQDVRHGDTLQMLLGPRSNLQCAVLRTLLGWRRKMENNKR